jgi:hypothetical protein
VQRLALAVALSSASLWTWQAAGGQDFVPPEAQSVAVSGTAFQIREGSRLIRQDELKGSILTIKDDKGDEQVVRIDSVMPDPKDSEIELYGISVKDPTSGQWQNMCQPGPDGLAMAFPLSGEWTPDGRHVAAKSFLLTCTAGAIGKCVRFGYKPWKTGPAGESLWQYHQACTRMVRADYCGDGTSWTRDGTPIDYFDRLNINSPDRDQGMSFEAAWAANGAICVAHTRISELTNLDALLKRCPARFQRTADQCTESTAFQNDDALVSNQSFAR